MSEKPLVLTMEGDTARITLNRPKVRNALSIELSDMLVDAIQRIKRSTDTKFVVIKGAGNTFCAGDDIKEMIKWGDDEHGKSTQGANGVIRRIRVYQDMANSLEELDKMTICAVDGIAVGGGLEITMACDFVIATERAQWGMPEVDSGITPGWGGQRACPDISASAGQRRSILLGHSCPPSEPLIGDYGTVLFQMRNLITRLRPYWRSCVPKTCRHAVSSSILSTVDVRQTYTPHKGSKCSRED